MEALINYRNNSTAFASYLRRGNVIKYVKFTNQEVEEMLPLIDNEFYVINKNMTLYRGIDSSYTVFNKKVNEMKVGDIITDFSYISTSKKESVAKDVFSFKNSPIFIINFTSGSRGIIMDGIGGEYHDYQEEVLLPRNSKFIVKHISETEIIIDLI